MILSKTEKSNKLLLKKLVIIAFLMFGFGFALIPFYKKICEAMGINNLLTADEIKNTQVDSSRTITIEFDANTRNLPWEFKPLQTSIQVHPGEMKQVVYQVTNKRKEAILGQAIPSYGPVIAAPYFKKIECFCFKSQRLEPGEVKQMPVIFYVEPGLPQEVNTITLSYTFFEINGAIAKSIGFGDG